MAITIDNDNMQSKPEEMTKAITYAPLKEAVKLYEIKYIKDALKVCDGNMTKTADMLGVHRTLLYKKLNTIID